MKKTTNPANGRWLGFLHSAFLRIIKAGSSGSTGEEELTHLNVTVTNPDVHEKHVSEIALVAASGAMISRIKHHGRVKVARPDDIIHIGDTLLVVGPPEELDNLRCHLGKTSRDDLCARKYQLVIRRAIATRIAAWGERLGSFRYLDSRGVKVTRITRNGHGMIATPDQRLLPGDILLLIGHKDRVGKAIKRIGRAATEPSAERNMP